MSGTAEVSNSIADVIGLAAVRGGRANQSLVEIAAYDATPPGLAVQSLAEVLAFDSASPALAVQCIVEAISLPPPYVPAFGIERPWPLSYKGYPPRPPAIAGNPYS